MITIDQLIYDPASNTGAKVGATIVDADGHQLDVNANGSINVELGTITDLDIRDLAFATDKVDVSGSEVSLDATTLAALENINATVSATDFDIRDLAFATDKVDASGSEVSLDSATLAALENINAVVTATDLDIRDLSFASDSVDVSGSSVSVSNKPVVNETNNAIKNSAANVTTTAALLVATALANRKSLLIQNLGNREIFIGDSGVTSANGVKISAGANVELKYDASVPLYATTATGTADVRILEAANS